MFEFTYWWATKQVKHVEIMRELEISEYTVVDWANFCRDICANWFEYNPSKIGRPGKTDKGTNIYNQS